MKILFTTTSRLGPYLAMAPLIRAFRAAGHQVRVATGAGLAPAVRRHGFGLWELGPDQPQDGVRQLVPMARAWRPDVVVHEPAESAGRAAAAASGAVEVLHGIGPADRARSGSTPYLDPCPPSLRIPGASCSAHVVPVRPEVGPVHPGERLPDALRRRPYERTVYLTLGAVRDDPDGWITALEAVRSLPVNVIGTTGPDVDPALFGRQPAHVTLARFVPQALVLPHVDAVVCHAGSGTVLGALAAGRPLVALPTAVDQLVNADRVARTGAGVAVGPEVRTPESVRSAVIEVLGERRYARAASALRAEIAALPSAARRVADLVALARSGAPAPGPVAQADVVTAA